MIGSKDDVDDLFEVEDKIIAILDKHFRENAGSLVHPASVLSAIYFYFLCILPEEDRDFLFDIVAIFNECSVGNDLETAKDRKRFFQKCRRLQGKLSR